nr:MAG: polyprotein [Picornavirales sp.]
MHIPYDLGLKTETLPEDKLHKKRVFCVAPTPTWITQKRLFQPIQNKLTAHGTKSRFTLSYDPVIDTHEWVQEFQEGGGAFAAFDWSSFDFTVAADILCEVGVILGQAYVHGRENCPPHKVLKAIETMVKDMTFASALHEKLLLLFIGGIRSGMSCTSLLDSIACLVVIYKVFSRHIFPGMTPHEFFEKVRSRHGGDDLVLRVERTLAAKIDLGSVIGWISKTYGMKLTIDTKTDDIPEWTEFADISFLSRTFIQHPQHPNVWISKLKTASISSTLCYSESSDPSVQLMQIENAAPEVYAHGIEAYQAYRKYAYALSKFYNLAINVPSYERCGYELWAAIMTKESTEIHERMPSVVVKRNNLKPLSQSLEMSPQNYVRTRSAFTDALAAATSYRALRATSAYADFIKISMTKPFTSQTVKFGTRECRIFPRNAPVFWGFCHLRMNLPSDGNIELPITREEEKNACDAGTQVLESWDSFFANEDFKENGLPKSIPPSKLASYDMHVTPYFFLKDGLQGVDKYWDSIKFWALDGGQKIDKAEAAPKRPASSPTAAPPPKMKWNLVKMEETPDLHFHNCTHCFRPYGHYHKFSYKNHPQYAKQCPYRDCSSFGLDKTRSFALIAQVDDPISVCELKAIPGQELTGCIPPWKSWNDGEDEFMEVDIAQMDPSGSNVSPPGGESMSKVSGGTGQAMQPFAEDASTALTSSAENPPVLSGGTGAAPEEVFQNLGGFTVDTIHRGGFANSALAACYAPCPLSTLDIGVDTVENTILDRYNINPWDPNFAGPFIAQWASLHQRFAGSFKMSLHVASAGTILGKVGIYYVPGDCVLPDVPTRQSMVVFQHVIVDLQQPSSEAIVIRNSNRTEFYLDRDNTDNRGQIIIMAYTSVANTYGAKIMPPIYPSIMLAEDAMFFLPYASLKKKSIGPSTESIPPIPPTGTDIFLVTEGKNYPMTVPNTITMGLRLENTTFVANHALTSGVSRIPKYPVETVHENELAFRWGAWKDTSSKTWKEAITNKFGSSLLEGYARRAAEGKGTPPACDTINTMEVPYDFERVTPEPDDTTYQGFSHTNALFPSPVQSTAKYLVGYAAPDNGDVDFGRYTADGGAELIIKPVFNSNEATLIHDILVDPAHPSNKNADRFKLLFTDVPLSMGTEQDGNTPGGDFKHNVNYTKFKAARSCVCTQSFPANGGTIPPGYKLVHWFEKDDITSFPFGVSGVQKGITGPTHCPTKNWNDFFEAAKKYLDSNDLASYQLRGATVNGQTAVFLLFNHSGIWAYDVPDYSISVSERSAFQWFLESTHKTAEWPILQRCSVMAFQTRMVGGNPNNPQGDRAQSMAMGAAAGLLSGLGNSISSFQNHQWDLEMQRNQFGNQNKMQMAALANSRTLTEMNNKARVGAAIQLGKNQVGAIQAQISGSNPMRNNAANAAPVNIPDGTQAARAAASP